MKEKIPIPNIDDFIEDKSDDIYDKNKWEYIFNGYNTFHAIMSPTNEIEGISLIWKDNPFNFHNIKLLIRKIS